MSRTTSRSYTPVCAAMALVLAAWAAVILTQAQASPPPPTDGARAAFHAFDIPAASATAIITGSLTPGERNPVVAYAITVALDGTDSVLNWTVSDGGVNWKCPLNSNTALDATNGAVYTFLVGARRTLDSSSATVSYNLECATTTRVRFLQVDEIRSDAR